MNNYRYSSKLFLPLLSGTHMLLWWWREGYNKYHITSTRQWGMQATFTFSPSPSSQISDPLCQQGMALLNCYSVQWTLRNPRQMATVFTFLRSTFMRRKGRGKNTTQTPQLGKSGYETTTSLEVRIMSAHLQHLVLHFLLLNNSKSFPHMFNILYWLLSQTHNKCSLEEKKVPSKPFLTVDFHPSLLFQGSPSQQMSVLQELDCN